MTGIYIALATFLLTMAWYHRRKPHENKLDTIISLLGSIKEQYKTMDNQIAALIAQLNTKTDIIAAEVAQVHTATLDIATATSAAKIEMDAVLARLNAGQAPSQDEIDALTALSARLGALGSDLPTVATALEATVGTLQVMGKDPANPLPDTGTISAAPATPVAEPTPATPVADPAPAPASDPSSLPA